MAASFIELQNRQTEKEKDKEYNYRPSLWNEIVASKTLRGFVFLLAFAVIVPAGLYFVVFDQNYIPSDHLHTCLVDLNYRVPCGRSDTLEIECASLNCCFNRTLNQCYHYIPSKYYYSHNETTHFYDSKLEQSPFGRPTEKQLGFRLTDIDQNNLQIELSVVANLPQVDEVSNSSYWYKLHASPMAIEIFQNNTNKTILTTANGPLVASKYYWEWSVQFPHANLFGLGGLALGDGTNVTKIFYKNKNDHNTVPIFLAYLDHQFYSLVIDNDGPLELTVLPTKLVLIKSLAGSRIQLNFASGTTPSKVLNVHKFALPPYWSLGPHICRDGNATIAEMLDEYKKFSLVNEVHYVSDCIHEDLFLTLYNATDEEKQSISDIIKGNAILKTRFLLSFSPQVPTENLYLYGQAVDLKLFYKYSNGTVLHGTYKNKTVGFIDYRGADKIWKDSLLANFSEVIIDGFVLKDNWPADDTYQQQKDDTFQYFTKELSEAMSNTLPWDSRGDDATEHISIHNHYSNDQVKLFEDPMKLIMTASYDQETAAPALIQNFNISWTNLKQAITTTLYHSVFSNPFVSIPVCGSDYYNDTKSNHEALCLRWYIVAATFPIFRISSDWPRRDPTGFKSKYAASIAIDAMAKRQQLLPYYYTTLAKQVPLVRPMFYDFYFDNETFFLDEQYMLGEALLVTHPLAPEVSSLRVYLPPNVTNWFEFWGGVSYKSGWNQFFIVETDWIMFIGAGYVVPLRMNVETMVGLDNPNDTLSIVVALNCTGDNKCIAEGSLTFSSVTLVFTGDDRRLTIGNIIAYKDEANCTTVPIFPTKLTDIRVYGLNNGTDLIVTLVDLCNIKDNTTTIEYLPKS